MLSGDLHSPPALRCLPDAPACHSLASVLSGGTRSEWPLFDSCAERNLGPAFVYPTSRGVTGRDDTSVRKRFQERTIRAAENNGV